MVPSPSLSHETSLDLYTNEFRDRKQPQNTKENGVHGPRSSWTVNTKFRAKSVPNVPPKFGTKPRDYPWLV